MKNELFRKGWVLGIMVLFVGASVIPSISGVIETDRKETNEKKNTAVIENPISMNSIIGIDETVSTLNNILYVGGSGPGNYTRIQDAIDNASYGDTVFVYDDSSPYYENVIVDKSIDLIGEDKNTTVIDGRVSMDYVIYICADEVDICRFTITNSSVGIHLQYSDFNKIYQNKILNNWIGLTVFFSNNNQIYENSVSHNNYNGIEVYDDCSNNFISKNSISNNSEDGIWFESSSDNIISSNIINSNDRSGLWFEDHCYNNIIYDNTISFNKNYGGIHAYTDFSYNIISCNAIINNDYGIRLMRGTGDPCVDNQIYHNNLINNSLNAYDDSSNTWDNGYPSGGNYWDDYTGEDSNGDGIGDTPYNISGGNNMDRYPLMDLWDGDLHPIADFTWTPSFPYPEEMILFDASASYDPDGFIELYEWDWDNDGVFDESYTNPTATHSWSSQGFYSVTLRITDNTGLTETRTKQVRVAQPPEPPTITGPTSGKAGTSYNYNFVSTDPDGDDVYYLIVWGDETGTGWIGPYLSGEKITKSHTWFFEGSYTIRCKAKDTYGAESEWGTLIVTMPKNQQNSQSNHNKQQSSNQLSSNPLFFQILQRLMNIR